MNVNWVDIFILGIIFLSTMMSFVRGFVKESISLATWLMAIYIGLHFSPMLADLLTDAISTPSVRLIVSFAILFLAVLILGGLINFLVSQVVNKTGLSGTNRLMGSIFGCARGVVIVGLVVLLARHTALPNDPWWQESAMLPKFEPVADAVGKLLPERVHKVSHLLLEE